MGATHLVLIGTLVVAGSQGLTPRSASQQARTRSSELVPPGKDPYARIFRGVPQDPSSPSRVVPLPESQMVKQAKPRVVCGMVVVPVKPDADARMVIRPNEPQPEYKIRKISPKLCNE